MSLLLSIGTYCACGYANLGARKVCDSYCAFPCKGNTSEACGADDYGVIYNVSTTALKHRRWDDTEGSPLLSAKLGRRGESQWGWLRFMDRILGSGNPVWFR